MDISREELEQLVKKAEKELQERLDKMTPEERAQAEMKAQKAIEEDRLKREKLLEDCAKIMGDTSTAQKPKFCTNCGAPAGDGKFCTYCGSPLQKTSE